MRSGIPYPDEKILIVRPCLVSLCIDVRPAAKLLSFLLYRYSIRQESKEDAENINHVKKSQGKIPDQDTSYRIYRKQSQLVKDLVGECTAKTLHDVAIPLLQVLGYMDFEDSYEMNCYTLHMDRILRGLEAYSNDLENKTHSHLEKFLIEIPELEIFLTKVESLEKFLIDKKNFQLQLEKVLIENRKISNCHRGRKLRTEVPSDGNSKAPKSNRENKRGKKEGSVADEIETPTSAPIVAPSPTLSSFLGDKLSTQRAPVSTPKRVCKEKPLPSKKAEPVLSEKAQAVWEVWLQMPWNKEMAPDLTDTAAKHCEKLSTVEITVDIMFKIRNFANKNDNNGFYKDKAWTLGNVVKEYPNWKSAEYKIELQIPKKRKMTDAERNALPY